MTANRLTHLEAAIEKERRCFYKIGKALKEIHDDRLYRELLFESFEAYVRARWDMGKAHAHRLIEAARVIDNLSPIGDKLPENEAQLRPLAQLQAPDQRRLWRAFLDAGMELSARNIRRFVTQNSGPGPRPDLTDIIGDGYKQAVMAMLDEIRLAKQDRWQHTSREAGLYWLNVMKDNILAKE